MTDIPTLDGYITQDGISVVVWCKHCQRLHSHGHGGQDAPLGTGDGHRVAHCAHGTGYQHGYYIQEVGRFRFDKEEIEYVKQQKKLAR